MSVRNSKLVYSTDAKTSREEICINAEDPVVSTRVLSVKVKLERKGRGGKSVTIVSGLRLPKQQLVNLLKDFKRGLGAGGAVRDDGIEIQGDHCDYLLDFLQKRGYRPKRSGG